MLFKKYTHMITPTKKFLKNSRTPIRAYAHPMHACVRIQEDCMEEKIRDLIERAAVDRKSVV